MNALSFLAVIVSLVFMRFPKFIQQPHSKKVMNEFKEGWIYLRRTPSIGFVILLLACVSFFALPFITLLPIYAKDIFNGNASTFGYLNSFIGIGAIGGAFFLASLHMVVNYKKILFVNLLIFGGALALFSYMTIFPIALFFVMLAGFGMMSQTTITNTIIQTSVSTEMRGRVISYYVMAFAGMQPLGGLFIGTVSHYIGAQNTILAEGIAALLIAVVFLPFLLKGHLRKNASVRLAELDNPTATTPQ